jgi:KTSC domain
MKRVPLSSSAIAAVTYNERQKTLEVEFREGDTYRYTHVPEFVYQELLTAASAGAFWNQVKDNYEFTRVREG